MYNIEVYYPQIEIEILTEKDNLVFRGTKVSPSQIDTVELVSDVLTCMTKRDMGVDCPTFSLNLIYRDQWFYSIGSNDLVIIKMARLPGEKLQPVFFGLIDDIRKSEVFAAGKPKRSIAITGRGFGKALINFEIGVVREAGVYESSLGYLGTQVNLAMKSASGAIQTLLDHFVKKYINYRFGQGVSFLTYARWNLNSRAGEMLNDISGLLEYQGSLWNLVKELQNSPFNELYWEINDGFPTLFLRPTPFNERHWNALQRIEVFDEDIIEDNTGRSDLETYTLYSVGCRTYMSDVDQLGTLGYMPLWYKPYYGKYGIKRLNVTSLYAMYASRDDTNTVKKLVTSYTQDLFNWNIKNNSMYNGHILVKGSNKYKLGSRLFIPSQNMEYYVESVVHNFNILESFTTQLGITRGIQPDNRFTPPWGKYEEFDPTDLSYSGGENPWDSWDNPVSYKGDFKPLPAVE